MMSLEIAVVNILYLFVFNSLLTAICLISVDCNVNVNGFCCLGVPNHANPTVQLNRDGFDG